jgi:hypothetical protein
MKLKHAVQLPDELIIPAGTELHFSNEGVGYYEGREISIYGIPTYAIEMDLSAIPGVESYQGSDDKSSAKLAKGLRLPTGKEIPAGTVLEFSAEGFADFEGEQVNIYGIPTHAFEMTVGNYVDPNAIAVSFADVKPGDAGTDRDGQPMTILATGIGKAGFDSLNAKYGNAGIMTWELLSKEEQDPDALQLVAYTDKDNLINIDKYSINSAAVISNESAAAEPAIVEFADVAVGHKCIDREGKELTVYACGQGKTNYDNWCAAFNKDNNWDALSKEAGDADDFAFVYAGDNNGYTVIDAYGSHAIHVPAEA